MKKIITSVAAVALFASFANAHSTFKSGFKAGVGAGYSRHSAKVNRNYAPGSYSSYVSKALPFNANKSAHSNKALGEVHFGFDQIKNNLYSAVELDYRYGPTKIRSSSLNVYTNTVSLTSTIEQKHKHDFGLTGKLGGLVKPNFALYAIANVRYGMFSTKFTGPDFRFVNTKKNQKLFGFGGGIGCAYALKNNTTLGVDLTYDTYKNKKINNNVITTGVTPLNRDVLNFGVKKNHVFNAILKISKTF